MYGKIFESIFDGSLYGQWEAIFTMMQLIVLADADGVIDMTPAAISGKTSTPLEIVEKGLKILSEPDPDSRTPGYGGVRIRLVDEHKDWGWFLVNHKKYANLRTAEDRRAYMRDYMRERRKDESVNNSKQPLTQLANKEEEEEIKINGRQATGFDDFWKVYPKKRKKKTALGIWKRTKPDTSVLIADVQNRIVNDAKWLGGYIPDPTTYLSQERWNDEVEAPEKNPGEPQTTADYAAKLGLTQNPGEPDERFKIRVRDEMILHERDMKGSGENRELG